MLAYAEATLDHTRQSSSMTQRLSLRLSSNSLAPKRLSTPAQAVKKFFRCGQCRAPT